jgi:periplasmic glucans biosynthesis protein
VDLLELPTRSEFEDNIVAYFTPKNLPGSGQPLRVAYRIVWRDDVPSFEGKLARVVQTRAGRLPDKSGNILLTVDFNGASLTGKEQPIIDLPPRLEQKFAHLKPLPDGKTIRLHLGVVQKDPKEDISVEIRAHLVHKGEPVSETWVYPWSSVATILVQPVDAQ